MGAFAPSPLLSPADVSHVRRTIVEPVVAGFRDEGDPYRGFLYVSLMLTPDGPKVIEFNVRLGDPEAQAVLPLVQGPFGAELLASATGSVTDGALTIGSDRTVGIVLAARGYPGSVETGQAIAGLDRASARQNVQVFHAGTREDNGRLVTAGGRVMTVVGRGPSFAAAMTTAYGAVGDISFEGMQYRRDIGRKAIER
jgi:phosphoribosylamine--glycine ligase